MVREAAVQAASAPVAQASGEPVAGRAAPTMVSSISEEALLEEWVSLVEKVEHVSPLTGSTMRLAIRVVRLTPGYLAYELAPVPGDPGPDIRRGLEAATGNAGKSSEARVRGAESRGSPRCACGCRRGRNAGKSAGKGRFGSLSASADH
jgi:DNA polymerase-3 subunit gamma/tau